MTFEFKIIKDLIEKKDLYYRKELQFNSMQKMKFNKFIVMPMSALSEVLINSETAKSTSN
jgi:hypothetical protein